jgi:UDP-3-O-[3-hydroxymyristoyl] glucosamine N-acyltransferase
MKAGEIAKLVNGELIGNADVEVSRIASVEAAGNGDLAFTEQTKVSGSRASCLIAPADYEDTYSEAVIRVDSPKLQFAKAAAVINSTKWNPEQFVIDPTAAVASDAEIAASVSIGAFCRVGVRTKVGRESRIEAGSVIGNDVTIGEACVIHPNVVIEDGCSIGDRVILHSGVVLGADGFGFVRDEGGSHVKFPQVGTVFIESDVEIGANTCIDRGALGETRIGEGTKIDNLVQVGHNVSIGKRCVIAAQTGISGSVVIGDDCVIGGQVGFGDHVRVESGAVIGSQAGVLPGKIVRPGVWWGTPIQPLDEYKRQNAMVKGLGRLRDEVRRLKAKIG